MQVLNGLLTDMFECLGSEGSEEVCQTGTAAEGGDGTTATKDGSGASVFT